MNLKYKIYFNHQTENSALQIALTIPYFRLMSTYCGIVCKITQAVTFSYRTSEHNMEREEREAKLVLRLKVQFSSYAINVFCHIEHCYSLLTYTFFTSSVVQHDSRRVVFSISET